MALLQALRNRQVRIARAIGVIFAASWLGLAVQPCVAGMAGSPEAHAGGHGAMGHHEPAPEPAPAHDCPHCPPEPAAGHDCGTGVALDCDAIGVPVLPAKDPDDSAGPHALPGPASSWHVDWIAEPRGRWPADTATWHPPDRPLQQRFCTYLK